MDSSNICRVRRCKYAIDQGFFVDETMYICAMMNLNSFSEERKLCRLNDWNCPNYHPRPDEYYLTNKDRKKLGLKDTEFKWRLHYEPDGLMIINMDVLDDKQIFVRYLMYTHLTQILEVGEHAIK